MGEEEGEEKACETRSGEDDAVGHSTPFDEPFLEEAWDRGVQ